MGHWTVNVSNHGMSQFRSRKDLAQDPSTDLDSAECLGNTCIGAIEDALQGRAACLPMPCTVDDIATAWPDYVLMYWDFDNLWFPEFDTNYTTRDSIVWATDKLVPGAGWWHSTIAHT